MKQLNKISHILFLVLISLIFVGSAYAQEVCPADLASCDTARGTKCNITPPAGMHECNDGIDNDCDGLTDKDDLGCIGYNKSVPQEDYKETFEYRCNDEDGSEGFNSQFIKSSAIYSKVRPNGTTVGQVAIEDNCSNGVLAERKCVDFATRYPRIIRCKYNNGKYTKYTADQNTTVDLEGNCVYTEDGRSIEGVKHITAQDDGKSYTEYGYGVTRRFYCQYGCTTGACYRTECESNYGESKRTCQTLEKPVCNSDGFCDACQDGAVYNETTKKCETYSCSKDEKTKVTSVKIDGVVSESKTDACTNDTLKSYLCDGNKNITETTTTCEFGCEEDGKTCKTAECNSNTDCQDSAKPKCNNGICEAVSCKAGEYYDESSRECKTLTCYKDGEKSVGCTSAKPSCLVDSKNPANNECVECTEHSQCTDSSKPICNNNVCGTCTSTNSYNKQCNEVDTNNPICILIKNVPTCKQCGPWDQRRCAENEYCENYSCKDCNKEGYRIIKKYSGKNVRKYCGNCETSAECTDPSMPVCNDNYVCSKCSSDNDCSKFDDAKYCNAGSCVECTTDSQCGAQKTCTNNICVAKEDEYKCTNTNDVVTVKKNGETIETKTSKCENGSLVTYSCSKDEKSIIADTPVTCEYGCKDEKSCNTGCRSNDDCKNEVAPVCNSTSKKCEACPQGQTYNTSSKKCEKEIPTCKEGEYLDEESNQCKAGCSSSAECPDELPICDTETHTCKLCGNGTSNAYDKACAARNSNLPICIKGKCSECGPWEQKACEGNTYCGGKYACVECNKKIFTETSANGKVRKWCYECQEDTDCTDPTKPVCDKEKHACIPSSEPTCTSNADCEGDTPVCNTTSKKCEACPQGQIYNATSKKCEKEVPTCKEGEYLDEESNQCKAGCSSSAECPDELPICDTETHTCKLCGNGTSNAYDKACAARNSNLPICIKGKCSECGPWEQKACEGNTYCGGKYTCVECNKKIFTETNANGKVRKWCYECQEDTDCTDPTKPVCDKEKHACIPSSEPTCTSNADCEGDTPVCNTTSKKCEACPQGQIYDSESKACKEEGCKSNADCEGDTPVCNTTSKKCEACPQGQIYNATSKKCEKEVPTCKEGEYLDEESNQCKAGCSSSAECPNELPICDTETHTCKLCGNGTTNAYDKACAAKNSNLPICIKGKCTECGPWEQKLCEGNTYCGGKYTCVECNKKIFTETNANGKVRKWCYECQEDTDCTDPTKPVCDKEKHACIPSSEPTCTSNADCEGDTPVCNTTSKKCEACPQGQIYDSESKACKEEGCKSNADCEGDTPVCNTTSKKCEACPQGQIYNATSNKCEKEVPTCKEGEYLDEESNQCKAGCSSSTECPDETPICDTESHTCKICGDGTTSAYDKACAERNSNLPVCIRGKCSECGPWEQKLCAGNNYCGGNYTCVECSKKIFTETDANGNVRKWCRECQEDTDCTDPTKPTCDKEKFTCVANGEPKCSSNADCTDEAKPVCDEKSKTCVACEEGKVFDKEKKECVEEQKEECKADSDCQEKTAPYCDTEAKKCVGCLSDENCKGTTKCNAETKTCVDTQKGIIPILNCVQDDLDGTFTAYFGYENPNEEDVKVPACSKEEGLVNTINDMTENFCEQPSEFTQGRVDGAFYIVFKDDQEVVWTIQNSSAEAQSVKADKTITKCASVVPTFQCIVRNQDGTYKAHFGYNNKNDFIVNISTKEANYLSLGDKYQYQPVEFIPGNIENAFSVDFKDSVTWSLNGNSVEANSKSKCCTDNCDIISPEPTPSPCVESSQISNKAKLNGDDLVKMLKSQTALLLKEKAPYPNIRDIQSSAKRRINRANKTNTELKKLAASLPDVMFNCEEAADYCPLEDNQPVLDLMKRKVKKLHRQVLRTIVQRNLNSKNEQKARNKSKGLRNDKFKIIESIPRFANNCEEGANKKEVRIY